MGEEKSGVADIGQVDAGSLTSAPYGWVTLNSLLHLSERQCLHLSMVILIVAEGRKKLLDYAESCVNSRAKCLEVGERAQ